MRKYGTYNYLNQISENSFLFQHYRVFFVVAGRAKSFLIVTDHMPSTTPKRETTLDHSLLKRLPKLPLSMH